MKAGVPPTEPKARTGESTPPGMTARAASKREALVTGVECEGVIVPAVMGLDGASAGSGPGRCAVGGGWLLLGLYWESARPPAHRASRRGPRIRDTTGVLGRSAFKGGADSRALRSPSALPDAPGPPGYSRTLPGPTARNRVRESRSQSPSRACFPSSAQPGRGGAASRMICSKARSRRCTSSGAWRQWSAAASRPRPVLAPGRTRA